MLVRINSGTGGIREYLETGRKKGREFDRYLIDERYVLSGDIEIADIIIDSIQTAQAGAARYLHITLGFAERFTSAPVAGPGEITLQTMHDVTEAYRELLMAAYYPDEYQWYSEAHIPKVSHDLHATTGEALERLPHVHVVLPMRNLVDGRYLNPTGYGQFYIKHEQAIQEVVNRQFGLRSPLNARRTSDTSAVARHNAQFAAGSPKELRQRLAARIAAGDIASFEQLIVAAGAYGEVRVRAGKDGDYVNVRPAWASTGINLKDFTREAFGAHGRDDGKVWQAAAQELPDFDAVLREWTERVAFEARFLTAANRKHYRALDDDSKKAWLADKTAHAQARLRVELGQSPQPLQFNDAPDDRPEHERAIERAQLAAVAALQRRFEADRARQPPGSLADLRDLSEIPVAQHLEPFEEFLHPYACADLEFELGSGAAVRWSGAGDRGADRPGVEVPGDESLPSKPKLDVIQSLAKARPSDEIGAERLKADTSPTLVIEAAVQRFGLDRQQYDVTSARDGTPRIRHGDKHYNLGDFFTKHLNVPWEEARAILEKCYYATLADALPPPDQHLWRAFNAWRDRKFSTSKQSRADLRANAAAEILQIRNTFKAVKLEARSLAPKKRLAVLALARAEQLTSMERARARAAQEREQLAVPARNAMYRAFLTDMANAGQLNALGELRRLAKPDPDMDSTVTGRASQSVFPHPRYRVDHAGRVTYFEEHRAVVVDSAKGVSVIDATKTSHALALKIAVARYGTHLTFSGDAVFLQQMTQAARASGLRLTIRDAARPDAPAVTVEPSTIQR